MWSVAHLRLEQKVIETWICTISVWRRSSKGASYAPELAYLLLKPKSDGDMAAPFQLASVWLHRAFPVYLKMEKTSIKYKFIRNLLFINSVLLKINSFLRSTFLRKFGLKLRIFYKSTIVLKNNS